MKKNGVPIDNPTAIAEEFNNFFVNIGPNLAKSIPHSAKCPLDFLKNSYCQSMFFRPTVPEEITDIIGNLKSSSSSGYDNIPIKIVKFCAIELAPIMAHINNQSLQEGVFPDVLKVAKVVPIYKSGDKKSVGNYRPISILTSFSKISEKIVHSRLENYLIVNTIIHKNQFGFRPKLSTSMDGSVGNVE